VSRRVGGVASAAPRTVVAKLVGGGCRIFTGDDPAAAAAKWLAKAGREAEAFMVRDRDGQTRLVRSLREVGR
jgi:hypothetical protein